MGKRKNFSKEVEGKKFLAQPQDFSCFVYALANLNIALGLSVPEDLKVAKKIACCENGPTICHEDTIFFMGTPVQPEKDYGLVLDRGGIITVMHPIYNLHAVAVLPLGGDRILVLNSWLAANQANMGRYTIERIIEEARSENSRWHQKNWVLKKT